MRDTERRELTIALGPSEGRPDLKVLIDGLISGLRPREARPVDSSSLAPGDESSGPTSDPTSGAFMASAGNWRRIGFATLEAHRSGPDSRRLLSDAVVDHLSVGRCH